MSVFAILLAGPVTVTPELIEKLAQARVIAADNGIANAAELGVIPELWVGDFDSANPTLDLMYSAVARKRFPRDKDKTDGEIAIEHALERGATEILLIGAFGGERSDHVFMHLILALRYRSAGIKIELTDGRELAIPLVPGAVQHVECRIGTTFSILRFSDIRNLVVEGARWPMNERMIPFHSILTQSNEVTGALTISFSSGSAIVLIQMRMNHG